MGRILLVDDDPEFSSELEELLQGEGHSVHWIEQAEDGLTHLARPGRYDLVLLDNCMHPVSGLEFLDRLPRDVGRPPVILMTSAHTDRTVIQAMNLGAFGYVIKPMDYDRLAEEFGPPVREALEVTRRPEPVPLPRSHQRPPDDSLIVGRSRPMLDVLMRIGRLAKLDETVLILGETGTGKDLVAQALHTNSRRRHKPFVVMNCSAFSEALFDDEMFGHERGAFTGADKLRKGRFEHADGGTLFLDEVGDMPAALQAKLLRVLENREVVRLGSNDPIRVDVRVLAATCRDLPALVREGKFRQDLFYRLEGMVIRLPPLRERPEDVELLARQYLQRLCGGEAGPRLHPQTLELLRTYSWPGNVRQLHKVLCRATGNCRDGEEILPDDLDFGTLDSAPPPAMADDEEAALAGLRQAITWAWQSQAGEPWKLLQEMLERELLRHAVAQPGVSQVELARRLGMARNTLRQRLAKHGLGQPADNG